MMYRIMRLSLFSSADIQRSRWSRLGSFAKSLVFRLLPRRRQVSINWDVASSRLAGLASPWRPSAGETAIYRACIEKHPSPPSNALILGSTPELRDLLASEKISYIVADRSGKMIRAMGKLLSGGQAKNESRVEADWRDLPFPRHHFDLILGDLVLWQFLPDEQDEFLEKVSSLLSPSGTFITRVHAANLVLKRSEPGAIIAESFERTDDRQIASTLAARLFDRFGERGKTDNAAVMKALREYEPRNERQKSVIQAMLEGWNGLFLDYAFQSEDEITAKLKKYFSITSQNRGTDYRDAAWYPIIAAKPKTVS